MPRTVLSLSDWVSSAMSPNNDGRSSWPDSMGCKTIDLDALLTPAQFAQWIGESESWVRITVDSPVPYKLAEFKAVVEADKPTDLKSGISE